MLTAVSTALAHPLCGRPLALLSSSSSALRAVIAGERDEVHIVGPIHVSEDDTYLVVPCGPGQDPAVVVQEDPRAVLKGSLVVEGELTARPGEASLAVRRRWVTMSLFDDKPFDATVRAQRDTELLSQLNRLPIARAATAGRLFDREGLERVKGTRDFVGKSWDVRPAEEGDVDPTWMWSRSGDGSVRVHLAIFGEYEERYALINPVHIRLPQRTPPGGSRPSRI